MILDLLALTAWPAVDVDEHPRYDAKTLLRVFLVSGMAGTLLYERDQ